MKKEWADDFGNLYKTKGQHKYGLKLLAMHKIQSGESQSRVSKILNKSPSTLQRWIRRYESEGLDGLFNIHPGRGRKAKVVLDKESFAVDLEGLGKALNGGRIRGEDIIKMIENKYQVSYSLSGTYHLLKRLGMSWITGRSKHPLHDSDAQEEFKKTLSIA